MIAKFCSHGDSGVAALMKRVLSRAINPMYSVLHTWIFDGHLHDRYRYSSVVQRKRDLDS
jgi:hypothetical protein